MNGIEVNWYNQILAKKKTPKERRKLRRASLKGYLDCEGGQREKVDMRFTKLGSPQDTYSCFTTC